jgi:hypothetical protein
MLVFKEFVKEHYLAQRTHTQLSYHDELLKVITKECVITVNHIRTDYTLFQKYALLEDRFRVTWINVYVFKSIELAFLTIFELR